MMMAGALAIYTLPIDQEHGQGGLLNDGAAHWKTGARHFSPGPL